MFISACSSVITEIPVRENEYIEISNAEVLWVTTTDRITHEVTNYEFTQDKLAGEEKSGVLRKSAFETKLSEISFMKIRGTRDSYGKIITENQMQTYMKPKRQLGYRTDGFFGSGPIGLITAFSVGAISFFFYEDDLLISGGITLVAVIVSGAIVVHKIEKRIDQKRAIEKIEEQRYGRNSGKFE